MTTVPAGDQRSAPFFEALGRGTLLLRRCEPHGHLSAPEVLRCDECGSTALGWAPALGTGHVVTWTAVHSRPGADGVTRVSAVAGVVELDEGPWLRARLLAADPAAVRSGAAVLLAAVETEEEPVLAFRVTGR